MTIKPIKTERDHQKALKERMEQLELKPSDLADILGGRKPSVGNSQQKKETDGGDDAIFA